MKEKTKKILSYWPYLAFFLLGAAIGLSMNWITPKKAYQTTPEFKNPQTQPYVKGPTSQPPKM